MEEMVRRRRDGDGEGMKDNDDTEDDYSREM